MPPRKGGPSTEPLTEDQELVLAAWVKGNLYSAVPRIQFLARVVATFYWTGMHPAVLAKGDEFNLRVEGGWIRWNRTKTRAPIRFPLIPELRSWFPAFLETLEAEHPITYNHRVHEAGRLMGIPKLTPRSLRHTRAAVLMERTGFNTAKYLTGVTDEQLIDYGKRAASKRDLANLYDKGFD